VIHRINRFRNMEALSPGPQNLRPPQLNSPILPARPRSIFVVTNSMYTTFGNPHNLAHASEKCRKPNQLSSVSGLNSQHSPWPALLVRRRAQGQPKQQQQQRHHRQRQYHGWASPNTIYNHVVNRHPRTERPQSTSADDPGKPGHRA
jgi:hypothetical protein